MGKNIYSKENRRFFEMMGAQSKYRNYMAQQAGPANTTPAAAPKNNLANAMKLLAIKQQRDRAAREAAQKKARDKGPALRPEPVRNPGRRPTGEGRPQDKPKGKPKNERTAAIEQYTRDQARARGNAGLSLAPISVKNPGKTPTPQDIWRYTVARNANQLENIEPGPLREIRPGVIGADFPGSPDEWLERARQLEGIGDEEWSSVADLYREGSRQEGAENVYQHGYTDVNSGGNEAFGPAQIAKGTFPAWSNPQYQNRYNPVHNYVAMLRGLKNKYGSYAAGGRVIARPGGYG